MSNHFPTIFIAAASQPSQEFIPIFQPFGLEVDQPILPEADVSPFTPFSWVQAQITAPYQRPVSRFAYQSINFEELTLEQDEFELSDETLKLLDFIDLNEIAGLGEGDIFDFIDPEKIDEEIDATTNHAWLVVLGLFAQSLGLISQLEEASLDQQMGRNGKPQSKLIEFLVGILGGIEYLKDLNEGPNPIASDETVAQAWAQQAFSHYSQVSRTLDAADEETLSDVIEALRAVSQPYIEQAISENLSSQEFLTIDLDLTGRRVSPNSSDYPGAEFGHMADKIAKGYQAAVTSLVCERWGRLMLTLQRYSGRARSQDCLVEAVREVEQLLGKRPRRRTSLVKGRIEKLTCQLQDLQDKLATHQQQEQILRSQVAILTQEISSCKLKVEKLEAEYRSQGRQVKRYCKLAKARKKLDSAVKRRERCLKKISTQVHRQIKIRREMEAPKEQQLALNEWLSTLEAENESNPHPIKIVLRVDAGFSTGKNLTWLIECGYTILTKVHHSSSAHKWQRGLPSNASWTKVGKNAEAILVSDATQDSCPYPYQAMLVRYRLGEKTRLTSLLYYSRASST